MPLATQQRCCAHVSAVWPAFLAKREDRLAQRRRYGSASEKVAENILEDLFTIVLDWSLTEINNQVDYADLVLTRLGVKHLIVEAKRPGALQRDRVLDAAFAQVCRYADEQKVRSVAVSDGVVLYARDHLPGGRHRDRALVRLDQPEPPLDLWWLSTDGIYRDPPTPTTQPAPHPTPPAGPLHPKYHLPAACFGYVGDTADPKTWRLPYLLADGRPDTSRLPKAVQSILSNYRGAHVGSVPETAVPGVLVTLGRTARKLGKLPTTPASAPAYVQLQAALTQLDRLCDVLDT